MMIQYEWLWSMRSEWVPRKIFDKASWFFVFFFSRYWGLPFPSRAWCPLKCDNGFVATGAAVCGAGRWYEVLVGWKPMDVISIPELPHVIVAKLCKAWCSCGFCKGCILHPVPTKGRLGLCPRPRPDVSQSVPRSKRGKSHGCAL